MVPLIGAYPASIRGAGSPFQELFTLPAGLAADRFLVNVALKTLAAVIARTPRGRSLSNQAGALIF